MRVSSGIEPLMRALARRAGAEPVVEEVRSRPWASATFSGARHRIALRFEGAAAAARAETMSWGIESAEFDLGRHLLVDIAIAECRETDAGVCLFVEALVIEQD